jgi:hypothetical protein
VITLTTNDLETCVFVKSGLQETAAIAMARMAAYRAQLENPFDVMHRRRSRSLLLIV